MKPQIPLTSVLIKPSGPDCNLNCTYCFYLKKASLFPDQPTHRMSVEILENVIKQAVDQSGESIAFTWQGGEPALMGLEFFEKVIELQLKYARNKNIQNGFQTNGLLLNKQWAEFLKKYHWLVGLSLDGPKHIHDHYRINKGNEPTWEKVEGIAKMLIQEGVDVNVLSTITSHSVKYPAEIYHYFKSLGLTYMQFIPIVETDADQPSKAADFSVSAEDYGNFLCRLFDLWVADFVDGKPTTSIRHFESVFFPYVGFQAPECTMLRECGTYITIEHNGDVYSCDFFVEPKWKLGNVQQARLIDMLNAKKQKEFGAIKNQLPRKCKACYWQKYCYGGCTKDRIKDPLDNGMPRFCKAYMRFFAHADTFLKQLAVKWKKEQDEIRKAEESGGNYFAFK